MQHVKHLVGINKVGRMKERGVRAPYNNCPL